MFNKVVIVGNLTRDIELRYTPRVQRLVKVRSPPLINLLLMARKKRILALSILAFLAKAQRSPTNI